MQQQLEELETLQALYEPNDFEFTQDPVTSVYSGRYKCRPQLPDDRPTLLVKVIAKNRALTPLTAPILKHDGPNIFQLFTIDHLPPLVVNFTLPQEYPDSGEAGFTLDCDWLPRAFREQAVVAMTSLAHSRVGEPCLWEVLDFLETGLFSGILKLPLEDGCHLLDLTEPVWTRPLRHRALKAFVAFDVYEGHRRFAKAIVDCPICAEDKLGSAFTRLSACGHFFCHECLRESLVHHIAEGFTSGPINCLECRAVIDLNEVRNF